MNNVPNRNVNGCPTLVAFRWREGGTRVPQSLPRACRGFRVLLLGANLGTRNSKLETVLRTSRRLVSVVSLLLLSVSSAFAHPQKGEAVGFLTGFRHPISGFDHVLAMVAVGLWGAQLGSPAIWLLPVAFPVVMAVGGMLGLMGVPLPGVEYGIALSAILLGAAIMFEVRPPLGIAAALVAFFAIFHGHAHGTELPAGQSALLYSMGFVIATGCLHAAGIAVGTIHRWPWGQRFLRVAGALVSMGGLFFMWRAVA